MTRVLTLPGWYGSEPEHWQTQWERLDANVVRVEQANWANPDVQSWRARLREVLNASDVPTVLACHSLGCWLAVAERPNVVGALLVAPPSLTSDELPASVRAFSSNITPLPFPAIVVASRNDPYASLEFSQHFATQLGAEFVDGGEAGHLNTASKLGTWPSGRALLQRLCARAPFRLDARLAADTHVIGESELCLLLMMNDARYPWFILVPKRSGITDATELPEADQRQLHNESGCLARAMHRVFTPDKLNIGALGNVVRQLHVHHVARMLGDAAWPGPVWGHSPRVPRAETEPITTKLFADAEVATTFAPLVR